MTKPVLHLVVSDVRPAQAVGSDTPKPRDYAAVEFGGGWYHEAAIAACAPVPARALDALRVRPIGAIPSLARAGLTLVS